MTIERPPTPTEDRLPAWRRACLSYREMRQAGASDQEAHAGRRNCADRVALILERGQR